MDHKWLLFCPQLPATPSSPRVAIWRRMRSAGAIGLDNGLWLLPNSSLSVQLVEELKEYVQQQAGSSKTFLSNAFDPTTEESIMKRFQEDRAEEYAEFKEQCEDFLKEIEKEINRQNYSFAEFEENEQDLIKLEAWLVKVKSRDLVGGVQAGEAEAWLEKCRGVFQQFATDVFTHEDPDHTRKMRFDPGSISKK